MKDSDHGSRSGEGDGRTTRVVCPWAAVTENEAVGEAYRRLGLLAPEIALLARPGQFVHVLCPGSPAGGLARVPPGPAGPEGEPPGPAWAAQPPGVPFLRRPLSVHDADPRSGLVRLLVRRAGPGTDRLAGAQPGDRISLLGPLGQGVFPLLAQGRAIVVGGGIGVAPLFFLVRRLLSSEGPGGPGSGAQTRVSVLLGVAGAADVGLVDLFRVFAGRADLAWATEDGTPGAVKGPVTDLLGPALTAGGEKGRDDRVLYACGPRAMLEAVRRQAAGAGVPAWLSVEERMACGVGACRGCAVRVRGVPPYRLVCRDGPVFRAEDLDWGEEGAGP